MPKFNFDDVDLAIIAILLLGIGVLFTFKEGALITGCVTAIAALARGKK